ncbi:MAG: hypothetical protein HOH43_18315 [Candidatus Latescibacteria bacterium]|jgi:hypothetical protein|nr:hypothetical protein [Candidatus Latescibacterota bacterium]
MSGVECVALFKGHNIRAFSTWTNEAELYIDDICEDTSKQRIFTVKKRILAASLSHENRIYSVEVYAKALLSVRLQICIDGRQIAGEVL